MSTYGGVPSPTFSPLASIGASSFSPSPITTTPSMWIVSSTACMPSTAAWSAASLSPMPTIRAAASAAASVTRTSSSARLRSGGMAVFMASGSSRGYVRRQGVAGAVWGGRRPAGTPLGFQVVENDARRRSAAVWGRAYPREGPLQDSRGLAWSFGARCPRRPARCGEEAAEDGQVPADLQRDLRARVAGARDHAHVEDEHEGDHPHDRGHLAARPG